MLKEDTSMVAFSISILLLILLLINIVAHIISLCILLKLKPNGERKIHLTYLTSMICNEFIACLLSLISMAASKQDPYVAKTINDNLNIIRGNLLYISYWFTMVVIIADRVLEIRINLLYFTHWNIRKASYLILMIWAFSTVLCSAVLVIYHTRGIHIMPYFPSYVMVPLGICFIFISCISYTYIFKKFRESLISPQENPNYRPNQVSCFTAFRKSRFFLTVLLISTYILFQLLPVIVFTILSERYWIGKKDQTYIRLYIAFSYNIAILIDNFVCIFLEPNVKKFVKRFFRNRQMRSEILSNLRKTRTVTFSDRYTTTMW